MDTAAPKRVLKLHDVMDTWSAQKDLPTIKTEALQPIAEAHKRNIGRVYMLGIFPAAVVNAVNSVAEIRNRIYAKNRDRLGSGAITAERHRDEVEQAVVADSTKREMIISAGGAAARQLLQGEINFGFSVLNDLLSTGLSDACDAWLSAQVTGAWTAFEAVAEELWETSLNIHPKGLADLSAERRKGDRDKTIELWVLQKHGYNLSEKMGTVLKGKYSFDSLEGIREGYGAAFNDGGDEIKEFLEDKSLAALSLVRNLIVHNGAVADEPYLRRKQSLPKGAVVKQGSSIQFDGPLVSELITRPIQISGQLIVAVDHWLSQN